MRRSKKALVFSRLPPDPPQKALATRQNRRADWRGNLVFAAEARSRHAPRIPRLCCSRPFPLNRALHGSRSLPQPGSSTKKVNHVLSGGCGGGNIAHQRSATPRLVPALEYSNLLVSPLFALTSTLALLGTQIKATSDIVTSALRRKSISLSKIALPSNSLFC